jgi:hypothetical protein
VARLIGAVSAGLLLGLLGRLSDYSPQPVRAVFVLGAPWVVLGVAVGFVARDRRDAFHGGAIALVASVLAYYAIMTVVEDRVSPGYGVAMVFGWGVPAAGVGALFGTAGCLLRTGSWTRRRATAGVIGGVLAGEATSFLLRNPPPALEAVAVAELAAGAAVVFLATRYQRSSWVLFPAAIATAIALVLNIAVRAGLHVYGWGGA